MKRYTGKLNKDTQQRVEANKQLIKGMLAAPAALGKPNSLVTSIDETIKKYNPAITEDEIIAWVWYRRKQGIPMYGWDKYYNAMPESFLIELVQKGVLFFNPTNKELVPFPVFLFGNIYSKIASLKNHEEEIIKNYGASVYLNHLKVLEDNKPKVLSIQNPIESERPIILAISKFAKEHKVNALRDDSGVILTEPTELQDAYKDWLRELPEETFKNTRAYEIINYYLNGDNKPRSIDKIEWNVIKKVTRDEGERLFKVFLHEAIETTDQIKIDAYYNRKYNATAPLQVNKIPIGIEVSKTFKNFELDIRPAQREGIAYMELVGSGIIAYDVGVGKTITAIIELAAALKNGKCKRPLVVVPNPTYKNWIAEIIGDGTLNGVLSNTGVTVNEWFNLGSNYDHVNLDEEVPENSITIVTYEGFNKIGFNEHTQQDHFSHLAKVVGQISGSERDEEKQKEKFREIIGVGLKETIADIETLGFDYVVIDEAHNFKNVFSEVKSEKGENKDFHIKGGKPSNRAIKAFFLCNYIQRKFGKNVMLLTATPFTNSPLEIYSMLSLVAYDYMRTNGILNLREFFEQYISETSEYVVGVDGEIKQRNVVKSFNNRISLQKLINSHINFKTGEEANIPRPCKINLPKTSILTEKGLKKLDKNKQVLTYLQLTDEQEANQRRINEEASKGASKDDPGKLLRLMSASLNNALSPFLYSGTPENYTDFVENSPKILYTMECIDTVKRYHEKRNEQVSGQVIYIDRGKDYFKYIKQYLENELGYKKGLKLISNPRQKVDEVEIITGGMSTAKKEKIKDAFNEGVCKIIIGTSTIKEGINLQKKSTVLYNLYPNWNPTDIRQLEGRIWRQKNEFGYVRIVMPLMENSMDVFVFQKLEEKTSRINDLWSKSDRGNVLDEESLDPNEVKYALVTDIGVLMRFELKQLATEFRNKHTVLKNQIEDLDKYQRIKAGFEDKKQKVLNLVTSANGMIQRKSIGYDKQGRYVSLSNLVEINLEEQTKELQRKIERFKNIFEMLVDVSQGNHDDKAIIKAYGAYLKLDDYGYDWTFNAYKDAVSQLGKIERTLFKNRGYDENTNIELIKTEMAEELEVVAKELDDLKTEEFQAKLFNKIREEKQRLAIKGGDLDSRVKDFASLNHLLSYKFKQTDIKSCEIPTKELPPQKPDKNDKQKRIQIAKAKAKALKLKLLLAA